MTYRKLKKDEWDRLKPIFEVEEWPMPSAELATVFIAEEDDRIFGLLVLEMKLHAEPLWIRPGQDEVLMQGAILRRLSGMVANEVNRIKEQLPPGSALYFMNTKDENSMCELLGFKPMPDRVWRFEIR